MVSNIHPEVGQYSNLVTLSMHKLRHKGIRAFRSCARGRGISAMRAVDRMHSYCQWPKIGSVWQETNFRRGIDFGCKSNWIMEAWQQRKLAVATARREIIFNRERVESCLRQLDHHEESVQAEAMMQRLLEGQAAVSAQLRPFKVIADVEAWKLQYSAPEFAAASRFKFLVLEGDSRFGKTRFACSLFGVEHTYVCNCWVSSSLFWPGSICGSTRRSSWMNPRPSW